MKTNRLFQPLISQARTFERPARLFLLATVIYGILFSAWMLFFNFYILERGFDRDFLGLVNSMPAVSSLLFGIPLGMLSDRIGRKRAMLLGSGLAIACAALEVTLLNRYLILAMAFLNGMAGMLFYISQAPFMMKASTPQNRALLFSLHFGMTTLSGSLGNLFAGQLPGLFGRFMDISPHSAAAYQAVILTSVALGMFTLVPQALIREARTRQETARNPKAAIGLLPKAVLKPLTLKLALPNVLIATGAAILIPYMNVFFHDRFALPDQSLGVLFSLTALFTGIGSVIGPRLADRMGSKIRAVVVTQGGSLAFLMVVGFSRFAWLAGFSYLVRTTLMNMAAPLYHAFTMEQIPEGEQGTVNSVIELGWQAGWAVGPYISGVVQEKYGFAPLFIATGVLYTLAILLTWTLFHEREQGQESYPVVTAH
jgi:MFS family permease